MFLLNLPTRGPVSMCSNGDWLHPTFQCWECVCDEYFRSTADISITNSNILLLALSQGLSAQSQLYNFQAWSKKGEGAEHCDA